MRKIKCIDLIVNSTYYSEYSHLFIQSRRLVRPPSATQLLKDQGVAEEHLSRPQHAPPAAVRGHFGPFERLEAPAVGHPNLGVEILVEGCHALVQTRR